jgi:hypothetical protein
MSSQHSLRCPYLPIEIRLVVYEHLDPTTYRYTVGQEFKADNDSASPMISTLHRVVNLSMKKPKALSRESFSNLRKYQYEQLSTYQSTEVEQFSPSKESMKKIEDVAATYMYLCITRLYSYAEELYRSWNV